MNKKKQKQNTENTLTIEDLLQSAMGVVADNLFQCIPFEDIFTDTRKRKRLALLLRNKTSYHEIKRPYYCTIQDVFNRPYRLYGVQLKPKKIWLHDLFQLNTIPLRVQKELWRVSALDLTTIDVTEEAKDEPWLPTWAKTGWKSLTDKATKDDLQLFVTILKMVIARFAWMIQYHNELEIVEEPAHRFLSSESLASYPHLRSMKYVARWNSPEAKGWKKVETKAIDLYRNQDVKVLNGTLKQVNDFATMNPCFVVAANRRRFLSQCMKDPDVACAVLAKSISNKDWPRSIRDWPTSIQTNPDITKRLIQEGTKSVVSHILEKHRLDVDLLTMAMHRFPRFIEHGIMFQSKACFDIFQHKLDLSKDMEITFPDGISFDKRLVSISVKTSPYITITMKMQKELSPSRFTTVFSMYEYDKKIKLQFDDRMEKIIRNVAEKGMVLDMADPKHRYHQGNYWDTWWNVKKNTLDLTTNMRCEEFSKPSDYSAWEFTTLDHLQQLEALGWNNAFKTALDSFWVSRRIHDRDISYRGTKVEVIKYLADKYLPGYHPTVRLSQYKEEYRAHVSKELIEVRESLQVGQIWSRGSSKVLIIGIHEKYCTVLYLTGTYLDPSSPVLQPKAWFDPEKTENDHFNYYATASYDGSSDWVKVRHQVKTLMQATHPLEAILSWDTKVTPETYQLCVDLVTRYPKLCLGLTYPRTEALTTSNYTKKLYTLFKDTHDRLVFPSFDYDPKVDYMHIPGWVSFF